MSARKVAAAHPASTTGAIGSGVAALGLLLGAPTEQVAAVGILAGLAPAIVSTLVAHNGVKGVARALWGR